MHNEYSVIRIDIEHTEIRFDFKNYIACKMQKYIQLPIAALIRLARNGLLFEELLF